MKNYPLFILLGLTLLLACKKDNETPPRVETLEATPISSTGCLFKGKIVNPGSSAIKDFGFVYSSDPKVEVYSGAMISLGNDIATTPFEKRVFNLYRSTLTDSLYVRAYVLTEEETVYGAAIGFTLPYLKVQSVSPTSGKTGDRITITGKNFNGTGNALTVKFGTTPAKIVEATAEKLVVEVPAAISTNSYSSNEVSIQVISSDQSFTAYSNFRVIPTIKEFAPTTGTFGTTVTITGDNIPTSSYSVSVSFGGVPASVSKTSASSITVTVPAGIKAERSKITVTAGGNTTELPGEFAIVPPTIASFAPASGLPGTSVTITGSNFILLSNGYYSNANTVKFGDIQATIAGTMSDGVIVKVPQELTPGAYKITVSNGIHTGTAAESFTVTTPAVTGFSPASGNIGTEVTITGSFSNYPSVTFGTTTATVTSASATSITALVPAYGISPGRMKISVTNAGQTVTSADDFTVITPSITSFSPVSGTPGTQITITGTGFSPNKFYNTVKFGTVETTVVGATGSSITAIVPSNASAGNVKLSATVNGQTSVSAQDFAVVR